MKIWKGLFYCMWMSDKPLIQVLSCLLLSHEYVLQFGLVVILFCTVSDLPTPKPCKSGVSEKKLPKPGDFQNICQIKPKTHIIFVWVFFTLLVVCVVLSCRWLGSDEKILFYYPGR